MIALGIESTAHTLSIGIVNDKSEILALVSDTFTPDSGGLKPSAVFEHHYHFFEKILRDALHLSQIALSEINLIAFSQGPGLGPCLRLGAVFARTLSLKLQIPLIGVNHCIAHIEIGRSLCQLDDPITLYVSGGNTIISAFENNRYQIFGETMDIAVGNMIDMVARDLGIPHPGGPKIEELAQNGDIFIDLPYIVKGMDLSYSGLYSAVRKIIKKKHLTLDSSTGELVNNLAYSLQETAFAMLAEVFERAIAHTHKKTALLTGGVAANQRLQQMVQQVCHEHGVVFHVVPPNAAGDNGAMIAWTGLLDYRATQQNKFDQSKIIPKWRLDSVSIPWRSGNQDLVKNQRDNNLSQGTVFPSNQELLEEINLIGDVLFRGAEALIIRAVQNKQTVLIKYRYQKRYRHPKIDNSLRELRTIKESKNIIHLSHHNIPVPLIFEVSPKLGLIIMQYFSWQSLKDIILSLSNKELEQTFHTVGKWVAIIHNADVIHGDLTTSNILWFSPQEIVFIDFGLSQRDISLEDIAMDIHLFKQVLISSHGKLSDFCFQSFLDGYKEKIKIQSFSQVLERIDKIEHRGRYIAKSER